MRKAWLAIWMLAISIQLSAASFQKTYESAPLADVLHDIETHFGLQFMYRPTDIAAAPAVTAIIRTDDYRTAMRQALGQALQFTERKGIIIITPVRKKPEPSGQPKPKPQPKVQTAVAQPEPMPQIAIKDTFPTDTTETIEREQLYYYAPIALLQPYPPFVVGSIDTTRLRIKTIKPATQPTPVPRKKNRKIWQADYRHCFYVSAFEGYGSALCGHTDIRYNYYFHRNWGVGIGINCSGAGGDSASVWREDVRLGIPIALYTRWPFTEKWGLHASLSAGPAFKIYHTAFDNLDVDIVPVADVDAAYAISPRTTLLFGISARLSILGASLDPWGIGVHLGFIIGSK